MQIANRVRVPGAVRALVQPHRPERRELRRFTDPLRGSENILFTQELLIEKGLNPQNFIVVQKPYMERRSYATFKQHWPGKNLLVTSPQIPCDKYATDDIPLDRVINIMIGDLQRIHLYPAKGFQVYQEIPPGIWHAYERLIQLGFDKHLVKE